MKRYPMKLSYVPKEIIWGGNKLKHIYNKSADFEKIAESWELTVRDDGMSYVTNGEFNGKSLKEVLTLYPDFIYEGFNDGNFPLLIKFIDAADDLSVQVHPNDDYAALKEGSLGKTEMWYIVDADDEASLIYGLADGVTRDEFINALYGKPDEKLFNKIPVKKGDVFFIPAGQIHAICHGTLIAEIQQNSNVTYRIYDYDRPGLDGNPRELHVSQAIDTVKVYTSDEIEKLLFDGSEKRRKDLTAGKVICDSKYFRVTLLRQETESTFAVDEKSFASLLFTDAENARVTCCGVTVTAAKGDCIYIPAGSGNVTVKGNCEVLISEI